MESVLKEYFGSLKGKKVAVIGLGVSNRPLVEGMLDAGVKVLVCDKRRREDFDGLVECLERRGMTAALGPDYLDRLEGADVIFRTPGLHPDTPQLRRAVEMGAKLTSEMEALLDLCPCRIIAVTGSDGKTTTTTIIAGLLKAAGYRTFVGGNIGHPLLCQVKKFRPTRTPAPAGAQRGQRGHCRFCRPGQGRGCPVQPEKAAGERGIPAG